MVVNAAGAIENESDYYPWGGELKISAADSANHYKFTGKEQDSETGLDLGDGTQYDPVDVLDGRYYKHGCDNNCEIDPNKMKDQKFTLKYSGPA